MTTEQPYVPTEARVCIDYCNAAILRNGPGGEKLTMEQADQAFDRFIAKVKRDAAREALDGLARKARWKVADALENGSLSAPSLRVIYRSAEDYRDTHYPEDVTP